MVCVESMRAPERFKFLELENPEWGRIPFAESCSTVRSLATGGPKVRAE
jgi:hypothetical protein